jgi:hypothetical protein
MNSRYTRRLQKELMDIQKNPPPGIAVQEVTSLHKYVEFSFTCLSWITLCNMSLICNLGFLVVYCR